MYVHPEQRDSGRLRFRQQSSFQRKLTLPFFLGLNWELVERPTLCSYGSGLPFVNLNLHFSVHTDQVRILWTFVSVSFLVTVRECPRLGNFIQMFLLSHSSGMQRLSLHLVCLLISMLARGITWEEKESIHTSLLASPMKQPPCDLILIISLPLKTTVRFTLGDWS